jgi:hypothetical protein
MQDNSVAVHRAVLPPEEFAAHLAALLLHVLFGPNQ